MFVEEKAIEKSTVHVSKWAAHWISFKHYFWRQWIASGAWVANDFAFYGNKLQQNVFLGILFPTVSEVLKLIISPAFETEYKRHSSFVFRPRRTRLSNGTSSTASSPSWDTTAPPRFATSPGAQMLSGPEIHRHMLRFTELMICPARRYGRVRCQWIGFLMMFIFYIIIYAAWYPMGRPASATAQGAQAMQALYYLSSFFNQFGPNATTWLVAGEIFPTDIRATYHGFAAAMGKVGAIIASLWISYVSNNALVFLISAIWGICGAIATIIWLPDTTGEN